MIKSRKPEVPTSSAPLPLRSLSSWPLPKRVNNVPEDHQKLLAYRMEIFTNASNSNNKNSNVNNNNNWHVETASTGLLSDE